MSSYVCLCHLVILHMSSKIIKILSKSHVRHTMGPWDPHGTMGVSEFSLSSIVDRIRAQNPGEAPRAPRSKRVKAEQRKRGSARKLMMNII